MSAGPALALDRSYTFREQLVRYGVHGSGPALVFVHGTPFSSWVWHRIAPLFTATHQVFLFDLLGYGQSHQGTGQDVSLGVQNLLLAELLGHWGIQRPHVVAHDFGGATALRAHLLQGCDYATLTLIDPVAVKPWGSAFVRHVRMHESAFTGVPPYVHAAIVASYIRGACHRPLTEAELAPYVEPWLGERGQPAFYRQIAQMDQRFTDEIESSLPRVRCPTVILWGEEDQWIPVERGHTLQQLVAGARLVRIPQAGHLVQEDAPEAIVAALLGFLPAER